MREFNICQIMYLYVTNKALFFANLFFNLSHIDNLTIVCPARQGLLIILKAVVGLVCFYISLGEIGKKGDRKQDLPRANFNDSRFLFAYELNKFLIWQRLKKYSLDFDLEAAMQTLLRKWKEKDQSKIIIFIMMRLRNSLRRWDDLN